MLKYFLVIFYIFKEEQNTKLDSNGNDEQHGNENNGM